MTVAVLGAGAFGTALAISLAANGPVRLWARNDAEAQTMQNQRENAKYLPGIALPDAVTVTHDLSIIAECDICLLAVPMQNMRGFLSSAADVLSGKTLVACCKGVELGTGAGPMDIMWAECPSPTYALLTGPSFAHDIAIGLPTALTLACENPVQAEYLQHKLSTPALRLYRTSDTVGASLGGALKNVIAIACGVAMGAGLGESARAALLTRGHAEMLRYALGAGAQSSTLSGLSGLGDLVLTCTSEQSRNYRFGQAIGRGQPFDPKVTVEGAATARAIAARAATHGLSMPISTTVAALVENRLDVEAALALLLSRELKEE